MIHIREYSGRNEADCIKKINEDISDDKVINVIPRGHRTFEGYDEYDRWTEYFMTVIYRD